MADNAAAARRLRLRGGAGQPTILVSLSKGGADVRTAWSGRTAADEFRDVRAWVNISGIVTGTPLVAWLRARPLRCCGVRLLLRCRGQRLAQIDELRRGAGRAARAAAPAAAARCGRSTSSASRCVRDLSNDWARRGHARLAPLGPNDGGGILLRDVLDLPGELLPRPGRRPLPQPAVGHPPAAPAYPRSDAAAAARPAPAHRVAPAAPSADAGDDVDA